MTAKKTKATTFDPAAWAKAQPAKKRGGNSCWICTHPEARDAVAEWVAGNARGDYCLSHVQMHAALVGHFRYPLEATSVGNHIRRHGGR